MDTNNPYSQNPYQQGMFGMQMELPNSGVVLVLGICSIVICALGPILGIVALILAGRSRKLYAANPAAYTHSSFKQINTGRTCAIIGLCFGIFVWVCFVAYVIFVYMMVTRMQQEMMQLQNIR